MDASTDDITFTPPETVHEARERIATLRDDIGAIQLQLADPDKKKPSGKRMTTQQYMRWRRRAIKALTAKNRELRFVKRWVHEYQVDLHATKFDIDPSDPEDLLTLAYNLIRAKKLEGVDFDDTELHMADLVRDYLLGYSANPSSTNSK